MRQSETVLHARFDLNGAALDCVYVIPRGVPAFSISRIVSGLNHPWRAFAGAAKRAYGGSTGMPPCKMRLPACRLTAWESRPTYCIIEPRLLPPVHGTKMKKSAESVWPDAVHALLKGAGVRQIALVPDAGHARLIKLCEKDKSMRVVRLTTEEEGVALLAGAWLGGEKGVLLMQSSGVGNCINMLSLTLACQFPLLMLVTMRGDHGEFNPAQIPMGNATQAVLEALGVIVKRADHAADVPEMVSGALRLAFNTYRPIALLIGQRVLGAKDFRKLTESVPQ
jgi:sulfopyruvate decarboxylase alpha subunit